MEKELFGLVVLLALFTYVHVCTYVGQRVFMLQVLGVSSGSVCCVSSSSIYYCISAYRVF